MSGCEDRPTRCKFQVLQMLGLQARVQVRVRAQGLVAVEVEEEAEEVVAEAVAREEALECGLEVPEVVLVSELAVLC